MRDTTCLVLLLLAIPCAASALAGAAGAADRSWALRAGALSRSLEIRGDRLRTTSFRLEAGPPISCSGPEFRVCVGATPHVHDSDAYRAAATGDGKIVCRAADAPEVTVRYQSYRTARALRKSLLVRNTTESPLLLRWVEVESCTPGERVTYAVNPAFRELGDWGQPVYTEHLFFGIEFPAARSTALQDGSLQLREYPGIWLQPGESWQSHSAVVGGSPSGQVQAAFYEYVVGLSPHAPHVPRPFIYWNGFRVIMPPDRTSQGLRMVERARELKRLTGFRFDSWTYDAGFDMYRPDALWVPNEPDLWPKTRAALEDVGTDLGFWTSFSCIFDTPTHEWGAKQGYGLQSPTAYCLAEPKYARAMEERLSQIVREYGMRSINFDGMYWGQGYGCNTPGHGHLVGEGKEAGVYGTYAVVLEEMRIFRMLRKIRPDICLDHFICNEWSSPWWLMELDGVHTVPGDTVAAGIPSPWLRDELITVRDMQVWEEHRRLNRQFPLWAEDLYGNQVRKDHLIDGIAVTGESMGARWEDEYVMALAARGAVENHIVCCDLNVLASTKSGLRFLGEVGNWVRANAPIYRHFALLGGDPAKQEVFGYAHGDGKGRAVVGLRNPSIRTQRFDLAIGPEMNLGKHGPYQVTMVYPYRYTWPPVDAGQPLPITLPDFQVAILEVRSRGRRIPGIPDGRWREADGRIESAGPDSEPERPRISAQAPQSETVGLNATADVPAGQTAELQVGITAFHGRKGVTASATIDGAPAATQIHFRDRGSSQDAWILIPVPAGRHEVRLTTDVPTPAPIQAWLRCVTDREFKPTDKPAPAGLLPSLEPAELRRTYQALAPDSYATGSLPNLPSGTVWLGDLQARCVRSETGWGIVGWNRSCWPDSPTLRIGDKTYEKGLGVHAPGRFDFILDGGHRILRAEIGLYPIPADRRPPDWPRGSCRFRVEGDGRVLYESPVLRETDGAKPIEVDVTGVRLLSLIVDDGGDGIFDDLCTWGDARLDPAAERLSGYCRAMRAGASSSCTRA